MKLQFLRYKIDILYRWMHLVLFFLSLPQVVQVYLTWLNLSNVYLIWYQTDSISDIWCLDGSCRLSRHWF